jgi:hypothetical protein
LFSIVVVYNNRERYEQLLLAGLKKQTAEYELIPVNNTGGKFSSAAQALNYGGAQATGKYIMFIHQDVDLHSDTWLADAEKMLDAIPDLGIAGVAGISGQGGTLKERGRNVIKHTQHLTVWDLANPIDKPEAVQTLDCCLLIVPRTVFSRLKFDEETCNGWHLYGEDYCLCCTKLNLKAYVLPLMVHHVCDDKFFTSDRFKILVSMGPLTADFYAAMKRFLRKHRNDYKEIYTCNGEWNTYQPVMLQRMDKVAASGWGLIKRSVFKGKKAA